MQNSPNMNSAALGAAKKQLRSLMKQRLADISSESLANQSSNAFKSLCNFKPYADAKSIAVYLSMQDGEIQTDAIVRHALSSGKKVFVPYLHKSGLPAGDGPARLMDMVRLSGIDDYESLGKDKWGIPSVDAATVPNRQRSVGEVLGTPSEDATLDLILLPGVAFDVDPDMGSVRRLGHGKGFYDYFLHRYALATAKTGSSASPTSGSRPDILLYALALKEQLLSPAAGESVPVGPYDQPLDGLVLGDGQIIESAKP